MENTMGVDNLHHLRINHIIFFQTVLITYSALIAMSLASIISSSITVFVIFR